MSIARLPADRWRHGLQAAVTLSAGPALVAAVTALALATLAGAVLAGHDSTPTVATVRADYVKRLVDGRDGLILVDMRKPSEYRAGHLPGAISVPLTELDRRFREIPRAPRVVLYCGCPVEDIATAFAFLSSKVLEGLRQSRRPRGRVRRLAAPALSRRAVRVCRARQSAMALQHPPRPARRRG